MTGMTIANFEVPHDVARTRVSNPLGNRGIYVTTGGAADLVELWLATMPTGTTDIMLHRLTNAPRLLAQLGAHIHGATIVYDLLSAIDPYRGVQLVSLSDGWLGCGRLPVSTENTVAFSALLDPERARLFWCWLTEWVSADVPHSRAAGAFTSLEDQQAHNRALNYCAARNAGDLED